MNLQQLRSVREAVRCGFNLTFRLQFPDVKLHLHQGAPKDVARRLLAGEADVGIATEALAGYPQLVALPCFRWTHSVIVPPGHSFIEAFAPTLDRATVERALQMETADLTVGT